MRIKTKHILIGLLVGVGLLAAAFYGLIVYLQYDFSNEQVVTTDILVTESWTDIVPESPMNVSKQIQTVYLEIKGYKLDNHQAASWEIKLPDGTVIKPELQLIDGSGNTFILEHGSHLLRQDVDLIGFSITANNGGNTKIPDDRTYTKLRIRSDKPFRCSKIIWSNRNLK